MDTSLTHFDNIKFVDKEGNERWSTRKLQTALGYSKWQDFENAIEKAKSVCENIKQDVNFNFMDVHKPIISGKGRTQEVKDYHVTRFAAFLIAMNGDERKQEISNAQAYFAVMTLFAENVLNKSPKEQLQDQLGMLQFVHKVVRGVFRALSHRGIVENKQLALYGKVAFDYFRLEVGRANRQYTEVIKYFHGDNVLDEINVKGDIVKMQAEIKNGEVSVQMHMPFGCD